MPYSVSPTFFFHTSGGKNSAKRSTRMPTALAAAKWPSSCMTISQQKPAKARNAATPLMSGGHSLDQRARGVAREAVGLVQVGEVAHRTGIDLFERALDHLGDACERQLTVEEGLDGDLVRRVEDARRGAAGDPGLAGEPQAGERVLVRRLEVQLLQLDQVE